MASEGSKEFAVEFGISTGGGLAGRSPGRRRFGLDRLRSIIFLSLLLLLCCFPAVFFGQDSAYSDNSGNNKYTLSGTVVNAVTGEGVARALVEIFGAQHLSVLTGADGHFEFSGLSAQQTAVGVRKPGFFNEGEMQRQNGWTPPTTVTVGPDAPAVVLKLVPEGVIVGRITTNGEPLEDVPVRVVTSAIEGGRRQWAQSGGGGTDEDGEFRIAALQPGEYYVVVGPKPPFAGGASKGPETGYGRVFYPNAAELDAATPVVLGKGQRVELDISLKAEPWYRVKGVVRGADPTANLNFQLTGAGENEGFQLNPATGEFETMAPAGNYRLEVEGMSPKGPMGSADVPVTVNSDVGGLQVALGPASVIPVQVKMEPTKSGQPSIAGGVRVGGGLRKLEQNPPVSMGLWRAGFDEQGRAPVVGPDDTGKPETMAMRNLVPGSYWMEIGAAPPWYVQSAQCGNIDLLREMLTVASGAPCAGIEIVLRDDGASLSASGTWEGDPAQATMVLLPERAPEQATAVPVSRGGEAQFDRLAPGNYNLVLVDSADGLEYKSAEAMSAFLSKAAHVTLTANQKGTVSVELVRGGR
jgi:hypothetical protein